MDIKYVLGLIGREFLERKIDFLRKKLNFMKQYSKRLIDSHNDITKLKHFDYDILGIFHIQFPMWLINSNLMRITKTIDLFREKKSLTI